MVKRLIYRLSLIWLAFILVLVIAGPQLRPNDPYEVQLHNKYEGPSQLYPLGTDALGRCLASRLIEGVRPTVGYAFIVMILTLFVGLILGVLAGYFRGWIDGVISFLIQLFLSIPSQIMIFVVVALVGDSMMMIVASMVLLKWAWYAKMIRDEIISVATKPYVIFAKIARMSSCGILWRHVIPTTLPFLAVLMSMNFSWNILNLTALSFLGLGIAPPKAEWGAMLNDARQVMTIHPEQLLYPGLAITITAAAIHLLGDALHDQLQVKGLDHE